MSIARPESPKARTERRPIRTLIVDDSPVALESLRLFLGTDEECELAGSGQDGRQAVEMAAELKPKVVVMDFAMPSMNGAVATRHMLKALPDLAVSTGSACNSQGHGGSHVLRAIGVPEELLQSATRFGLGRFTTEEEVEYAAGRVVEVVRRLREQRPV